MLVSRTLSEVIGAEVWLKFENLQFTAAYKERGALNKLLQLTPEERARGVIAASAGNHAQAVAYHAKRLGIPATIVMPESTPTVKVTQTAGHGAAVVLYGKIVDDAFARARELALENGYVFIHAFDDPQIIAGAGTVGLEMLEDAPDLDTIVVPIGGGGLMSGVVHRRASGQTRYRADRRRGGALPVDEVRHSGLPDAAWRRHAGRGNRGQAAGRTHVADPRRICQRRDARFRAQPRTCRRDARRNRKDGGGGSRRRRPRRDAVATGSGSKARRSRRCYAAATSTRTLLANVLVRDLVRQGRIARLNVAAHDQPGALAAITAKVYEAGVNVLEIHHSRIFTSLPAKDTMIEVECEARDPQAIEDVVARLEAAGFRVDRASLD